MSTLSTADRLLGSLVGTYIGHSYVNRQWNCIQTCDSQLYQSWLQDIQQDIPPGPTPSDFQPAIALPWLLYHHNDRRARHSWLGQMLSTASPEASHTLGLLYCLGDSLEWLMQCPRTVQHPLPFLSKFLQHQRPTYPASVIALVDPLIEQLTGSPPSGTGSIPVDTANAALALAIDQCLNYRENLVLALTGQHQRPASTSSALIGCLMGAWGGMAVIPSQWTMSLSPESRQDFSHLGQHLYRNWAGITCKGISLETLPLDL